MTAPADTAPADRAPADRAPASSAPPDTGEHEHKSFKQIVSDAPVIPVILLVIGGYLTWFGVHYWRSNVKWPSDPIKSLLTTGQSGDIGAAAATAVDQVEAQAFAAKIGAEAPAGVQTTGSGSATGTAIAQDALKYQGQGYVFGGNASSPGHWDCSSFVSYVLGHDFSLPLPGGKWGDPGFPPHSHGPTTGTYLLYGSPITRANIQPGDLVVWATHMGIVINSSQIVAARTTSTGTGISSIDGVSAELGELAHYRRINLPGSVLV
jgi:cell wall-associated NlpC family hydrolase